VPLQSGLRWRIPTGQANKSVNQNKPSPVNAAESPIPERKELGGPSDAG
jgi:hypothetical protein